MFKFPAQHLCYFLAAFTLTLGSGSAYADDTEIYFGGTTTLVPPNVLLILDTSNSMSTVTTSGQTRMEVMKEALVDIIQNAENVNIGLMRFTNDDGGPVLFPIAPIDAPVTDVVSEPAPDIYTVISGNDDAEELKSSDPTINGTMLLTDPILEAPQDLQSVFYRQKVTSINNDADEIGGYTTTNIWFYQDSAIDGARFVGTGTDPGILPSPGDLIQSAVFRLWPADASSGGSTLLYGHDIDASPAFADSPYDPVLLVYTQNFDISSRGSTNAKINWNFAAAAPEEVDVTPIVQEIIERGCTTGGGSCSWDGNSLTLIANSKDTAVSRRFYSFENANADLVPDQAPELDLTYTSFSKSKNQIVGLRFQNVNIPQGATVTSAKLIVTPKVVDTAPATWWIHGELSTNSNAFSTTKSDLSSRPQTTKSTSWELPPATTTSPIASCDDGVCSTSAGKVPFKELVQEIVDQTGWCGGNAMSFFIEREKRRDGTRFIESFEGDPLKAARLQVTYDATSSSGSGCYRDTDTAQLNDGNDDAEEANSGAVDRISPTLVLGNDDVGIRFSGINVPQNATILNAYITLSGAAVETTGTPGFVIHGEDSGNALAFESLKNNITGRTKTTANTSATPWSFNLNTLNEKVTTPNLRNIVQEIVNRSDWASGNAMAFLFDTDTVNRTVHSFNGDSAQAARLKIEFEGTAGTQVKTVRDRLIELINDMQPASPTNPGSPIVETMLEGLFYWRGEEVRFGKSRDGVATTRLSHPGSYCNADNDCNGANTASYPPYGVYEPLGCSVNNLNALQCAGRRIDGTPTYISPFSSTLTCQANFQVLLADGEADSNDVATAIETNAGITCQTLKSDGTTAVTTGEKCGIDMAGFLSNNDQNTTLPNDQLVNTYTVGFETSSLASETLFLKDVADAGQGQFFEAANATDLTAVFNTILSEVKASPTSFVSPSLATNAFNRLLSRDEIYFGLFTPSFQQGWPGNVKKYRLCVDTTDFDGDGNPDCVLGEILDDNKIPAIDNVTNKFKDTATSVWSGSPDGRATTKGGAGAEMTDYNRRTIYTDATPTLVAPLSGTSLSSAGHMFDTTVGWDSADLSHIRDLVCPVNSIDTSTTDGLDCQARMLWVLGKIFQPNTETDASATTRWTVNDVLHSSPTIITYGGSDTDSDGIIDEFYDKLVVGTNEGGLRFINGATGLEEWTFIPQELLANQGVLFTNPQGNHLYGLDVTPTLRVHDVDKDGFIEPLDGDFVHVYVAMRRGGSSIYALDITPSGQVTSNSTTITPKFLWRIDSSTAGFNRLSNTWSQPRLARIATVTGDPMEVLIFGGGYDPRLDAAFGTSATGGADNLGNAIYIVNPATGAKIMSISGSCSGCSDIEVPDMHFSIASRITLLDSDGDGLDDRIYVGDTGGQVWRVDLGEDFKPSPLDLGKTVVGRLAAISTAGGTPPVDERRFFNPPAVVQVKDAIFSDATNGEYDYVLIGSGNRSHPLDKDVSNRFYAFRDKFISSMPDIDDGTGTGTATSPAPDHLADSNYPQSSGPITNGDMIDVTTTVLDSTNATHLSSLGWYFDFDTTGTDGEKVLSAGTAIAGAVFFTTYVPDASSGIVDPCSANIGGGYAYDLNILSTKAALDWDEDGTLEDVDDRKKALGGGIPSDVVPVFTKEGVVGIVGIEGGAAQLGTLTGLPRVNTYWYEEDVGY